MYVPPALLIGLGLMLLGCGVALWRARTRRTAKVARLHDANADPIQREFARLAGMYSRDGLVVQDLDGIILWVNSAYCTLMEMERAEIIGRNPLEYARPPEAQLTEAEIAEFRLDPDNPVYQRLGVSELAVFPNITKSGRHFWNQISQSFHTIDTGETLVLLVCRDVTEQIEREERLREASNRLAHIASHDTLTGAANRAKLMSFANHALEQARNAGLSIGLIQIDLDRFKKLNDTHGHLAGDAILQHVTRQARSALRDGDLFARMGGDEFVAICPDLTTTDELLAIGNAVREAIALPLIWDHTELSCNVSVGAALTSSPSDTLEDLLRKADFALYDIKRRGRGAVAVYDTKLDRRQQRLSRRSTDLAQAVRTGRIEHHFQPYCDLKTGRVLGFEALARWPHPTDGLLQPADFLPLAREMGLMVQIDFLGFRAANRMCRRLREEGHLDIKVHINCAGSTICHPEFRPMLIRDIEDRGLTRADLAIEVREAVIFDGDDGPETLTPRLHDLHHDGFPILLDDFAAGYHGLTHLNQLPITGFKIERSVINDLLDDPTNIKVVSMVLELSADLGLMAVTEGIETVDQAVKVLDIGGQIMQGHLLSAALPPSQVLPWLTLRPTVPWPVASAIAPDDAPRYQQANS